MPSMRRSSAASTHEKGDRTYASSSRLKMMLVARISASDESNERALELAIANIELHAAVPSEAEHLHHATNRESIAKNDESRLANLRHFFSARRDESVAARRQRAFVLALDNAARHIIAREEANH